ncbi:MAG: hypothetical protein LH479_03420 [Polaromonas sp.]|nr:hypothetical protein [Polaromonas sp.]
MSELHRLSGFAVTAIVVALLTGCTLPSQPDTLATQRAAVAVASVQPLKAGVPRVPSASTREAPAASVSGRGSRNAVGAKAADAPPPISVKKLLPPTPPLTAKARAQQAADARAQQRKADVQAQQQARAQALQRASARAREQADARAQQAALDKARKQAQLDAQRESRAVAAASLQARREAARVAASNPRAATIRPGAAGGDSAAPVGQAASARAPVAPSVTPNAPATRLTDANAPTRAHAEPFMPLLSPAGDGAAVSGGDVGSPAAAAASSSGT